MVSTYLIHALLCSGFYFLIFSQIPNVEAIIKDLSHGYDDHTINYPGGLKFNFIKQHAGFDSSGIWYSANDFATAEHCGTHLDAPYHFYPEGRTVGEIPLENLLVKGIFVDASNETNNNPNYTLPSSVLEKWKSSNGELPEKTVILIGFGWAKRYANRKEYLGPTDQELRFPGISREAADWMVNTKRVIGVGVDTPSLDVGISKELPVHKILAENDIYGLENVALTSDLPPVFSLIVMPMKITNGTGAPCRIVAFTDPW